MPPKKRFRTNDNANENLPSGTTGSSIITSNEVICYSTIPALATAIFLESLRDVRLLSVCRLVCKSWNIVSTESLRSCSVVRLKEGSLEVANFTIFLLRCCLGTLEHLPSPFKSFKIEGMTLTNQAFINMALLPKIEVTSLELQLGKTYEKGDASKLGLILASHKSNITDLTIDFGSYNFEMDKAFSGNRKIMLPSLKSLKFIDDSSSCKHIPFMKIVLGKCNPERLDLKICDEKILIRLLSQIKAKNLKHFKLELNDITIKAWEHLNQLVFLRLKYLNVSSRTAVEEHVDLQQWQLFCKNVSSFVTNFTTNIELSTELELRFPKLKEISVCANTDLSGFTSDRFPSLSKVLYSFGYSGIKTPENDVLPHEGVKYLVVHITGGYSTYYDFGHNLLISLTYLRRQFPNVSSLDFTAGEFRDFTLISILEAFPKLNAIYLDGNCDFICFSGMDDSTVTKYLQMGRPIEKIPRHKSITDFMELQSISFGSNFEVQSDMIIHCLPRIPKLRHVSLHWNKSLSAPLLRDSIGHLEEIVILNSSKFPTAMAQVSKMLPNAYMK